MRLDINISGMEKLFLRLKLLDETVSGAVKIAMYQSATIVQKRAQENISGMHGHTRHVKTGNLMRSIQSQAGWTNNAKTEIVGIIGTDVPYAPYVEALPDGGFLYPALMEVGREAMAYFKAQLALVIKGF